GRHRPRRDARRARSPGRRGRRRRRGRPAREGDDDRRRGQGADPGVPRHLHLEDPLPGGPEAADAAAHARRLPAVLGLRRAAAADDPAPAARRVPAAAGHPPGARRGARRARGRRRRRADAGRRLATRRRPAPGHLLDPRRGRLLHARAGDRGDRRRPEAGQGARGLRHRLRALAGRRARIRRRRARHRARRDRARALRGGGAQPARLPHLGRARGGAVAADPHAGPALAQSRAPQGGGRGAREPRRGGVAPQAPAARARPAQDRRL
ncbi:MAG: hypothetical protein AVDCRST_MAG38-2817, partial [uncultured Solirubrobacteraceae bacterium]